jgi:hypothetical protein
MDVMNLALKLELDASRNYVAPAEGARLVRLVLLFHEQIIKGGAARKKNP